MTISRVEYNRFTQVGTGWDECAADREHICQLLDIGRQAVNAALNAWEAMDAAVHLSDPARNGPSGQERFYGTRHGLLDVMKHIDDLHGSLSAEVMFPVR